MTTILGCTARSLVITLSKLSRLKRRGHKRNIHMRKNLRFQIPSLKFKTARYMTTHKQSQGKYTTLSKK